MTASKHNAVFNGADYKCKSIGRKLQQSSQVRLNCMYAENRQSSATYIFCVDTVLIIVARGFLNSNDIQCAEKKWWYTVRKVESKIHSQICFLTN